MATSFHHQFLNALILAVTKEIVTSPANTIRLQYQLSEVSSIKESFKETLEKGSLRSYWEAGYPTVIANSCSFVLDNIVQRQLEGRLSQYPKMEEELAKKTIGLMLDTVFLYPVHVFAHKARRTAMERDTKPINPKHTGPRRPLNRISLEKNYMGVGHYLTARLPGFYLYHMIRYYAENKIGRHNPTWEKRSIALAGVTAQCISTTVTYPLYTLYVRKMSFHDQKQPLTSIRDLYKGIHIAWVKTVPDVAIHGSLKRFLEQQLSTYLK